MKSTTSLCSQQVVVDVLDRGKRLVRNFGRRKDIWMLPVETVDVADEAKAPHPLVDAEQIEIRRADEIDWRFVAMKKQANIGESA